MDKDMRTWRGKGVRAPGICTLYTTEQRVYNNETKNKQTAEADFKGKKIDTKEKRDNSRPNEWEKTRNQYGDGQDKSEMDRETKQWRKGEAG